MPNDSSDRRSCLFFSSARRLFNANYFMSTTQSFSGSEGGVPKLT
jgi:hypothetical protein